MTLPSLCSHLPLLLAGLAALAYAALCRWLPPAAFLIGSANPQAKQRAKRFNAMCGLALAVLLFAPWLFLVLDDPRP